MLKKLAAQTAIYGISSIIARFLNYLLTPYLTRIMTTGEYGGGDRSLCPHSFLSCYCLRWGWKQGIFILPVKAELLKRKD